MTERMIIADDDCSEWNTSIPHRNWCFTLNNYTNTDWERLTSLSKEDCNYIIVAKEVGAQGTPHLQGYLELAKPARRAGVKKILDPLRGKKSPIHVEPRAAARRERAIIYCKKGEISTEDWNSKKENHPGFGKNAEYVEVIHKLPNQGHRSDWDAIRDKCKTAESVVDVAEEFPEATIKYINGIERLICAYKLQNNMNDLRDEFEGDFTLRPWQKQIVDEIDNATGDGVIRWLYCEPGLSGKTTLAKFLALYRKALVLSNGRTTDIAQAWNGEKLVIFDLSRTSETRVNMDAIERVASGLVFSSKYQSTPKIARCPYVMCFSNALPQWSTLSIGRWNVSEIRNGSLIEVRDPRQ